MSRLFQAILVVFFLASCGGGSGDNSKAPKDLDNACSILEQRPTFIRAFRATERKWGVPVHVQMAIIYQESKFISDARTPLQYRLGVIPVGRQSSAFGYSQALDATWKEYQRAEGGFNARRDRIDDATDFMGWYMAQSRSELNIPMSDARRHYLAYHDGRTGYRRGTYLNKPWLLRIADEVGSRSFTYQRQLSSCRAARR